MAASAPLRIKSTEFHRFNNLPGPSHPLISLVDYAAIWQPAKQIGVIVVFDFFSISVKRGLSNTYDIP